MASHGDLIREEEEEEQEEEEEVPPGKGRPGDIPGTLVAAKMTELAKLKDKLTKVKDESVQSWLDSKPLIDELENLRSQLQDAKRSADLSNTAIIPQLHTQLQTLNASIKAKKDEELKIRTASNEINEVLQRTQSEMEQIKIQRDQNHRARLRLKQVLRLRRQTLRTLQLSLRAIHLESQAYGASAAEANRYITHSQMDEIPVKLTQEEYRAFIKRSKEETSLAEWRISVFMEQKQVAKETKDSAAQRFRDMNSVNGSRKREHKAHGTKDQPVTRLEEPHPNVRLRSPATDGRNDLPQKKPNSNSNFGQRKQKEHTQNSRNKKSLSKRKKSSCFARIRILLVQKIKKFF